MSLVFVDCCMPPHTHTARCCCCWPTKALLFSYPRCDTFHSDRARCHFTPSTAHQTYAHADTHTRVRFDKTPTGLASATPQCDAVYRSKVDSVVNRLAVGSVHKNGALAVYREFSLIFYPSLTQRFVCRWRAVRTAHFENENKGKKRRGVKRSNKKKKRTKKQSEQKWMEIISV